MSSQPEPELILTEQQLRQFSGERGSPMYVAYKGIVYDVTDCPKWRRGIHENLHWPGQDLTGEMNEAPHDEHVFLHPCARKVGKLASE